MVWLSQIPVQKIKRKGDRDKIFASIKSHKNIKIIYFKKCSKCKEVENVKKIWIDISLKVRTVLKMLSIISSVQFSCSVVSDSLQPHEPQHARPPCPSPTPRVHPNPYPSSQWCHPTISSSVIPFSSCPQSFPALGSFQMSQLFASGGQSIGASASTSALPMIQLKPQWNSIAYLSEWLKWKTMTAPNADSDTGKLKQS